MPNEERRRDAKLAHLGNLLGMQDAAMLNAVPMVGARRFAQHCLKGCERCVNASITIGVDTHLPSGPVGSADGFGELFRCVV
jgi:hypothetical protein